MAYKAAFEDLFLNKKLWSAKTERSNKNVVK